MIRRPKATDTEEDLLKFQKTFLESNENPSAVLQHGSDDSSGLRVGKKRSQYGGDVPQQQERDVVQLQTEGYSSQEGSKPPLKKSRFKEEREKRKMREPPEDPHEAMERQDQHITKVLADIQEHETFGFSSTTVPTRLTRRGFPSVHALDGDVVPKSSSKTSSDKSKRVGQSKSLFAQQFEKHGLEYFGIETAIVMQPKVTSTIQRDFIEPVNLGDRTIQISESRPSKLENADDSKVSPSPDVAEPVVGDTTALIYSDGGGIREYESSAAQTWDIFMKSSLISGEGLMTMGVPEETADEEVTKIHQENVNLLSSLPEEEILIEKERIQQLLGPKLVSFLQSKKKVEHQAVEDVGVELKDNAGTDASLKSPPSQSLAPPEGWVHMDVIEKDKMEWMTDVTKHTPDQSDKDQPKEIRFSLNGLVVPHDVDIPTHLGLHHHGDEPQAAGYTLNELGPFCRSTVLQQRVLGLQTLARVIQRAKQGEYTSLVEGSVLGKLLNDGVPLLFRLALDESNNAVMFAAVNAIHSLLVLPVEEFILDEYSYCYYGNVLPALKSHDQPSEHEGEDEKETDAEIFQKDVIEGFLHVKLLHRVRYILEVCCPPANTVIQLLEILTRLARHSTAAATQVLSCPRLLGVVFGEFLPLSWTTEEDDSQKAHGRPQVAAMRLVMALCSAGRHLTAHMVSNFKLMSVISRYTILHPCDLGLPKEIAYELTTVSLKTWTVALYYGLGDVAFRDTYPVVLQQLQKFSALNVLEIDQLETKRIAALLKLVQAALHVSAITQEQLKTESEKVELKRPALEWSCATGMLNPVINCLMQWMEQTFAVTKETLIDKMVCIAGLIHYVADYYNKLLTQKPAEISIDCLQAIESLASGIVSKLLHSIVLTYAIETLSTTSSFTSARPAPNLSSSTSFHPSLVTHLTLPPSPKQAHYGAQPMQLDDFQKLLHPQLVCFSCTDFILSYLNLCLALSRLHKGIIEKVTEICVNAKFQEYLEKVMRTPASKCSCFDCGELYLLYTAVKLYNVRFTSSKVRDEKVVQLYHSLSFKLITLLPTGMEHLVYNLFKSVLLNPALLCPSTSLPVILEKDIENLTLRDPAQASSFSQLEVCDSVGTLLSTAVKNLSSITTIYLNALEEAGICSRQKVDKSKSLFERHPLETKNILLSSYHAPLVPVDWVLFPIIQEYNKSVTTKSAESAEVSPRTSVIVSHTLQFLLLLEYFRPKVVQEVPITAKLARLMCVFLIGNDLFLDDAIRCVLLVLLKLYCNEEAQATLNFNMPIPGLASFEELYSTLLDQFAAVSYGDQLFARFIMLPLQQRFSVHFRRMVWNDHSSIIRIFSLPLSQVPVDVKHFLYPIETDGSLLEMYMSALASNNVSQEWSPLFYLIAIHHVHCYILEWNDSEVSTTQDHLNPLQKRLLQGVLQLKSEELKQNLLFYDGPEECRLKLKSMLTESQRSRLLSVAENNPLNLLL